MITYLTIALLIPLIFKYPRFFIYFVIFQWFMNDVPIYGDINESFLNERQIITLILFAFVLLKNNFSLKRTFSLKEPIHLLLLSFFLYVIISYITKGNPEYGLKTVKVLSNCVLIYIIVLNSVRRKKDFNQFIWAFIFIIFIFSLNGLFYLYKGITVYQQQNRLITTFEPNISSMFIVIALPLVIINLIREKSVLLKCYLAFLMILFVISIFLTGSRTGLLGLFFMILLLATGHLSYKAKLKYLFLFLSIALTLAIILPSHVFTRYTSFFSNINSIRDVGSLDYRIARANAGIKMFLSSPITGVGVGNYADVASKRFGMRYETVTQSAYNEYIRLASELGLVGLSIFLLILWHTMKRINVLIKKYYQEKEMALYYISIALSITFMLLILMNFALNSLIYTITTYIFIALIISLKRMDLRIYKKGRAN